MERKEKSHGERKNYFLKWSNQFRENINCRGIADTDDIFFYVVANDLFEEMIGEKYLRENYWKYLSEVIIMMYHTAKLYSDMGKNVLIDGILV